MGNNNILYSIYSDIATYYLNIFFYKFGLKYCLFQRNPAIKLYGLPWVFPGWLGGSYPHTGDPYANITALCHYIVNWIDGAKTVHGLHIDYIGVR